MYQYCNSNTRIRTTAAVAATNSPPIQLLRLFTGRAAQPSPAQRITVLYIWIFWNEAKKQITPPRCQGYCVPYRMFLPTVSYTRCLPTYFTTSKLGTGLIFIFNTVYRNTLQHKGKKGKQQHPIGLQHKAYNTQEDYQELPR